MVKRMSTVLFALIILLSAFNLSFAQDIISYTIDGEYVTVSINSEPGQNVGITVSTDARKYYINQGTTDSDGKLHFDIRLEKGIYESAVKLGTQKYSKQIVIKDSGTDPVYVDSADIYIKGYNGVILSKKTEKIQKGESILAFTIRVLEKNNIKYEERSGYISSIAGQSEKDKGPRSGWMYLVNGKAPDVGAGVVKIKDKDSIEWTYVVNPEDIGGHGYKDAEKNLIDDVYEKLKKGTATQAEILKSAGEAVKYFEGEINSFKLSDALSYGKMMTEILEMGVEKSASDQSKKELCETALNFSGILENYMNTQTNHDAIDQVYKLFKSNSSVVINVINNIEDMEKADAISEKLIDTMVRAEAKASENKINPEKNKEKAISIDFGSELVLQRKITEKILEKNIDKVKFVSTSGTIEMDPNLLGSGKLKIHMAGTGNKNYSVKMEQDDKDINILKKPFKITIPVEEDIKDKGTVMLRGENGAAENLGGIYNPTTKSISFLTYKTGDLYVDKNSKSFSDMENYLWAKNETEELAAKGLINGKDNNLFQPSDNITRAEFAALIVRMLKYNEAEYKTGAFKDAGEDKWYGRSVATAYGNGLIKGKSDNLFDPEGKITREEIAQIAGQILKNNKYKVQEANNLVKFEDYKSISAWSLDNSAIAVHNKVITGRNGHFAPDDNATRAEAALILYRLYNLILD